MAPLVERDAELALLTSAHAGTGDSRGAAVLVFGEAGIGKTSLVQAFLARLPPQTRVLAGACDDLLTARTLGPFRDIGRGLGGEAGRALAATADRDELLIGLLDVLAARREPAVLLVEDVHWADDATLDVLRMLARRLAGLSCLLLLTYREDGLDDRHPLRRTLGAFVGPAVTRVPLARLSPAGVAELAAASDVEDVGAVEVHHLTGGNPFFVAELLAAPGVELPHSVRDAVLARVGMLTPRTRAAVDLLSVAPGRVDLPRARDLVPDLSTALLESERLGILVTDGRSVWFRHELVRLAVERTMPAAQRMEEHRRMLAVLTAGAREPSLVVHHALGAGDAAAVVEYGVPAAREAAAAGAHREAVAHFTAVLDHGLTGADLAAAHQELGYELYLIDRLGEAVDHARRGVAEWRRAADPVALARALVVLARTAFWSGQPAEAVAAAREAVELLEPRGDSLDLARAYSYLGSVLTLGDQAAEAIPWCERARDLALRLDAPEVLAHALNYLGTAVGRTDLDAGVAHLREAFALAERIGHREFAVSAAINIAVILYWRARWRDEVVWLDRAVEHAREAEFVSGLFNAELNRQSVRLRLGEWEAAREGLDALLAQSPDHARPLAAEATAVRARLLLRTGDPEAAEALARAAELAADSGVVDVAAPADLAGIEAAWFAGDAEQASRSAQRVRELARATGNHHLEGEVLRYLARAGVPVSPPATCPPAWALGIAGDWRAAAAEWARLGDPYEQALELAESGDTEATLEALTLLDGLGATPAATLVRRRLRDLGVRHIPRGPQPVTRANPAGLTPRQLDVVALLVEGLTNSEIAARLVVSPRTVDHHVTAVLGKLGVGSRREVGEAAARLGLLP